MQAETAGKEQALADALLLDAALEAIPFGFCVWSPQFRLVMWNKKYRDFYGFSLAQLSRGMTLEEVVDLSIGLGNHPATDSQAFYENYTGELLANRFGEQVKSQEMMPDGRWLQTAHSYAEGLGWVVTHEDVSEQVEREQLQQKRENELARQNLRLDAAVNNISQGLSMCDSQGRLIVCNEPYARIYKLPKRLLRPGTGIEDILTYLFDHGFATSEGREGYMQWRRDVGARAQYGKRIHQFAGRTIMMQQHPMKDGGWVTTHEDITEQRQNEERIRHLARHDALTDLPNRIEFLEQMARTEAGARRGEAAAVMFIDLDRFKAVNDTLGHAVGDAVLKQVSARLWGATRETDVLARLGGDEFSLLIRPIETPEQVARVAERIIKSIRAPIHIDGQQIDIGVSIGIAMAPHDGEEADTLMRNADLALYKAKNEGRSTYHFFESGMDAALQQRRVIEAGLRRALDNGEMHLMFQPIFDIGRNGISCAEALLRWEHEGRIVSPAEFIPIAEETGLIVSIGEWVLRQACKLAADWPTNARVAVNLSPIQFKSQDLVGLVRSALSDVNMPASRLELEITESLLLAENDQTLACLHALRAMGVRICLDDFGTGYSSLSLSAQFPLRQDQDRPHLHAWADDAKRQSGDHPGHCRARQKSGDDNNS
ncbi:PAS-domain containing protein [Devosia algicola]|uniref:PAS-domain containing protein n=1 Tax=Devosia algicola TaxID=3026418 RepID=A0ABY7YKU4_9HYPH|nr:PAS-domain containing protein [Devosia algicola]WDR01720.1 PAS-domain containing protein [Devosia algicola]